MQDKGFELEVLQRLTKIETMLEDFKGVESKSTTAYNLSLSNKERLDKIEDNNRWAFRTALGGIITATISLIASIILFLIKIK